MKTLTTTLLLLATLASATAHAQVRKCIGPDGKVTYSDVLCNKQTTQETGVKINENAVDGTAARADARKYRIDKLLANARQSDPNKCKFSEAPGFGGNGMQLAQAATQECLSNLLAEDAGKPTENEAYKLWFANQQASQASAADQRQKDLDQRQKDLDLREKQLKCQAAKVKGVDCGK